MEAAIAHSLCLPYMPTKLSNEDNSQQILDLAADRLQSISSSSFILITELL
jgi:hypothetical protein